MVDRATLDVYAAKAEDYRARFAEDAPGEGLRSFLDALSESARVLDLGCGPGRALAHMVRAGHRAEGLDATPDFVRMAEEASGAPVTLGTFEDLDAEAVYDGIYANFSLLHAPKAEMPGLFHRIARALKPRGVFHIGLKTGTGERRDALGRFYAYYTEAELTGLLDAAGFEIVSARTGEDPGLDGTVAPWIVCLTRKRQ